jgi:transcriptional regulator with XRE-family HTH domain
MGDYAVKLSVRNGRILRRMRECGIASQAELARTAGVTPIAVNQLVCMRDKAHNSKGEWRSIAWDIATALQCDPNDLFNDQQRERALERSSVEVFMDAPQIQSIMSGDGEKSSWAKIEAQRLLGSVRDDRARRIVVARSEGAALEELAGELGLTTARIRQIEQQAYRAMRSAALRSEKQFAANIVYGAMAEGVE